MNNYTFNLQRLANVLIILAILIYGLIIAKDILAPLAFAVLFAFMLKPLCAFIERRLNWRAAAILIAFVIAIIPITILIAALNWQFQIILQDQADIAQKLQNGFNITFSWINQKLHFTRLTGEQWLKENSSTILETPIKYIGGGVSYSATFIINFALTFIYTFLLLLYRSAFKKFFFMQFSDNLLDKARKLLRRVQSVTQGYFYGLLTVLLIIGVLNSVGLWIIGLSYPVFWGFLASLLAIIPYVGTFTGGLITLIYALATTSTFWQPAAIVVLFAAIQFLEGNFITPKVVGESVKINPLAAIFSLVLGGLVWGVSGLVLALPVIAILKIAMQEIDILQPFSLLLSSELYEKEELFESQFNKDRHRLWSFFRKKIK